MDTVIKDALFYLKTDYDLIRGEAIQALRNHRHRCVLCGKYTCKATGIEGPAGDEFRVLLKCTECGAFGCVDHTGKDHM